MIIKHISDFSSALVVIFCNFIRMQTRLFVETESPFSAWRSVTVNRSVNNSQNHTDITSKPSWRLILNCKYYKYFLLLSFKRVLSAIIRLFRCECYRIVGLHSSTVKTIDFWQWRQSKLYWQWGAFKILGEHLSANYRTSAFVESWINICCIIWPLIKRFLNF